MHVRDQHLVQRAVGGPQPGGTRVQVLLQGVGALLEGARLVGVLGDAQERAGVEEPLGGKG